MVSGFPSLWLVLSGAAAAFEFGSLAGDQLQAAGCARAFFAGNPWPDLTPELFGELCAHHDSIHEGDCLGMLFNAEEFWLYQSCFTHPISLCKGTWTAPGSEEAIRRHLAAVPEPPLLILLRRLLIDLDLQLCEITDSNGYSTSYLGSGAHGHVFAVQKRSTSSSSSSITMALKVVQTDDSLQVSREFHRLMGASKRCPSRVLAPLKDSLRMYCGDPGRCREDNKTAVALGGGFLMPHVGRPFEIASRENCRLAFASLAELHRSDVIHGDPRLPNLLRVGGDGDGDAGAAPMWIDFASSVVGLKDPPSACLREDARCLARSMLLLSSNGAEDNLFPQAVRGALERYDATEERASELADAVCDALLLPALGGAGHA